MTLSKPGHALAVVCDYGHGGVLTLKFQRQSLGLSDPLNARDIETGERVEVTPEGRLRFRIRQHDFKLMTVDSGKP